MEIVENIIKSYYKSPIGFIEIVATDEGIASVNFADLAHGTQSNTHPILEQCINQLDEYFNLQRKDFNLKLSPQGTEFQKKVWQELRSIQYGQTATYIEIARRLGNVKALRAVGRANGSNPIAIIIPCHRIIGSNGKLIGYGGGLWRKKWLLQHENAILI